MTNKSVIIQYGHVRGPEGEEAAGPNERSINTILLALWNIEGEEADKYVRTARRHKLTVHEKSYKAIVFIAPAEKFPYGDFGIPNDDLMAENALPPEEGKQAWITIING